jgi:hypothetical protein
VSDLEVQGVFLESLAAACLNLQVVTRVEADASIEPLAWYPVARFHRLFHAIDERFEDPDPIKERIGIEMMRLWYEHGGRALAPTGAGFLRFQAGSAGYRSVVKGRPAAAGNFAIVELDEQAGVAMVQSTTPFDRAMERGVLIGGMQAPGDLVYVDVVNRPDPSVFHIRFR